MKSLEDRIKEFHHNRSEVTRALKYKLMAHDNFTFYRATCHLFYEDLHLNSALARGPLVWSCGDLHLENFGSYRAYNGLVYFDINDFDEAMLAPASWDLCRFLCSISLAADTWKYSTKEAEGLMLLVLKVYTRQLAEGKAYAIEKETSPPLIRDFFEMAEGKKEKEMVKTRMERKKGKLKIIKGKTFSIEKEVYKEVKNSVNDFLKTNYEYLKVRDVAFRIAGIGSLGIKRYVILAEDMKEEKWRLLDLKKSYPSSLAPYLKFQQPSWHTEAERIVTAQSLIQYAPPRYMGTLPIDSENFILKQLQPSAQKIDCKLASKKLKNIETVVTTMAQAVASAQIRSASRKGSDSVEELMKFSIQSFWQADLIQAALDYSSETKKYFREYQKIYFEGKMS
ncbi:hypothetical protein WSM22_30240 [Cytophagales bacterium WSM2-2]|nr:hypothetical protein WSM22_30240 [Cytophagales bacterium WSM2-2]